MLDYAIKYKRVTEKDVRRFTRALTDFYAHARQIPLTSHEYRQRFELDVRANHKALLNSDYGLSRNQLISITDALENFLARNKDSFDARVKDKRIIETHGDLRPEHICLLDPPVFIDCIEFNRAFRMLDPADELAFLAMECEQAGAPDFEKLVFETYHQVTNDSPPPSLVHFYKTFRTQLRAKLAIWHLRDHEAEAHEKWVQRAVSYLQLAEKYADVL